MFPILHSPAEDPGRAEERARVFAEPPLLIIRSKGKRAIVTSLADFRAKYPDARPADVAHVQAFYAENSGAIHVMTAQ